MLANFKALIFDLDGTLVDSSEVVRKVMESWCLKHVIPLQSVLDVCGGGRTEDSVSLIAPHLCAATEAREIERLESSTLDGLRPITGAVNFLRSPPTVSWAIATSSSRLTAIPKLETCGMTLPPVLITAESVNRGKPYPEAFLKAAQELGVAPADCLVFEDASNGVHSALAAGCQIIIIGGSCGIDDANIIGRAPDFTGLHWNEEGQLSLHGILIARLKE